jgi:hypothetical protein
VWRRTFGGSRIEGFIQRLEAEAVSGLPAFEREPTYDEQREYGLWRY